VYLGDHPAQGWGKRYFLNYNITVWKKIANTSERNSTYIRVSRVVENEVIPEDAATRLSHFPHAIGQLLLKVII
jgi:hypothetical protein